MKYVDEYRDGQMAQHITEKIQREVQVSKTYHFMEFCGGHTHAIFRYGIPDLLPKNVKMIHGPGCPVCILPIARIDSAIELAVEHQVILCSYGDMMRVPGSRQRSLLKAKAEGADIRMVYSCADALTIAQDNPDREVVFFAIGFETTTPPTALIIQQAKKLAVSNFSVFCNHVLTPSAISTILESPEVRDMGLVPLDGFIGPAHVSTVIGSQPYEYFAEEYQKPVVIAGFEPLDVLQAILMLIRQVNKGRAVIENEFTRAVTPEGNLKAKKLVADVFEMRAEFEWRGLGVVPYSGLRIKPEYSVFDAEKKFTITPSKGKDNKACECPSILRGVKTPKDCKLFGTKCTPENPLGSCMVSSEGACSAYYSYGRHQKRTENIKVVQEHED
ncbi:MAG: hydrogenase formation protein HypD [Porticoccus sp.]|nr:hydrogenase formation protein HypD [Porticoccus sp.]